MEEWVEVEWEAEWKEEEWAEEEWVAVEWGSGFRPEFSFRTFMPSAYGHRVA